MLFNYKIVKKTFSYLLTLIILGAVFLIWLRIEKAQEEKVIPQSDTKEKQSSVAVVEKIKEEATAGESSFSSSDPKNLADKKATADEDEKNPTKILISVPFTTQAPFGKWDEFHEEACEEASLVMLKYFLDGKKLDKDTAEKEIQDLIKYQMKKYGDYRDSDMEQLVSIAKDYYGIKNLKVVYAFKPEDIKDYLAKGKPIIVPTAGRLLKNPNFKSPGPLYHNLVLTGYEGDTIITNDPGTRRGQNYEYKLKTLYDAIHDFPGNPKNIEKGQKAMIVLE